MAAAISQSAPAIVSQGCNLKEKFPFLKNIFDQAVWEQHVHLGDLGLSFEGATAPDAKSVIDAMTAMSAVSINRSSGFTMMTLPARLTLNKLVTLIETFKSQGKFPGFDEFPSFIPQKIGNIAIEKPYTFLISNSTLKHSKAISPQCMQKLWADLNFESPKVVEVVALIFFTYITSENQQKLYDKTYTHCSEDSLIVGGFSESGLNIDHYLGSLNCGMGMIKRV